CAAAAVGNARDTFAVRRPARRILVVFAGSERPMIGAICLDDPEVRVPAVGHLIGPLLDVDDRLTVGRDLRVRGELEPKDVSRREAGGLRGESGTANRACGSGSKNSADGGSHDVSWN